MHSCGAQVYSDTSTKSSVHTHAFKPGSVRLIQFFPYKSQGHLPDFNLLAIVLRRHIANQLLFEILQNILLQP